MRILMLGHNYAPEATGIGPYNTELAEHFAASGHDVTVLTTFPHYPRYQWRSRVGLHSREAVSGVQVRRLRVVLPKRSTATWRVVFDSSVGLSYLLNAIGVHRPDLVLAVVPPLQGGLAAGFLSFFWRVPCVLLIQDLPLEAGLAVGMLKRGALYEAGVGFERLVYRMVDRIVVVGDRFRDNLLAKGIRPNAITVIPNWVDTDRLSPQPSESQVRQHLAGPNVDFLVLHAGTMGEKQGLRNVIAAGRHLSGSLGTYIVLVGDGPTRPQLEAQVRADQLDNVRILPIQAANYLPRMLAAADVLLLNQRADVVDAVVPSKLLSYMSAGRPVIAAVNSASVAAQLIGEAGCGVVVSPEDPECLAAAISDLQVKPGLRDELGRRGRAYVELRHRKRSVLELWDKLLAQTEAPHREHSA